MELEDLMGTTLQVAPQTARNSLSTLLLAILPQVRVPEDLAKWGSPLLDTLEYPIHSSAFQSLYLFQSLCLPQNISLQLCPENFFTSLFY